MVGWADAAAVPAIRPEAAVRLVVGIEVKTTEEEEVEEEREAMRQIAEAARLQQVVMRVPWERPQLRISTR